jgi:hypothetical protein
MDDHKAFVVDTQKGFNVVQSKLKGFIEKVESLKNKIGYQTMFRVFLF